MEGDCYNALKRPSRPSASPAMVLSVWRRSPPWLHLVSPSAETAYHSGAAGSAPVRALSYLRPTEADSGKLECCAGQIFPAHTGLRRTTFGGCQSRLLGLACTDELLEQFHVSTLDIVDGYVTIDPEF